MIFCFITHKLLNSSDFKASWMAYSKHPSKWRISWTFSINCNVQMIIYVRIIQESFKLLHNLIKTIRWQQQNHKPQLFGVGYMDPFPPLTYLVKHLIVLIKTITNLTKYVKKKWLISTLLGTSQISQCRSTTAVVVSWLLWQPLQAGFMFRCQTNWVRKRFSPHPSKNN